MSTLPKVRMHTITINVTFLQYSNTAFNDFEDEFVNRIREKIRQWLLTAGCHQSWGRLHANVIDYNYNYFEIS